MKFVDGADLNGQRGTNLADPVSPADAVTLRYLQSQVMPPQVIPLTAITEWNYNHIFPYPPRLLLIDQSAEEVEVGYEYPDATHIYVLFPSPFTGTAVLS